MAFFTVVKDPDAVLDYGWDWSAEGWLVNDDTISSSTWTAFGLESQTPTTELTIGVSSHTDTTTTVWLAHGIVGPYRVVNHITTEQGREDDRTILVKMKER